MIQQDITKIDLDLRDAHKDEFFSILEDNLLKGFLPVADEAASEDGAPEQVFLAFVYNAIYDVVDSYKSLLEKVMK